MNVKYDIVRLTYCNFCQHYRNVGCNHGGTYREFIDVQGDMIKVPDWCPLHELTLLLGPKDFLQKGDEVFDRYHRVWIDVPQDMWGARGSSNDTIVRRRLRC